MKLCTQLLLITGILCCLISDLHAQTTPKKPRPLSWKKYHSLCGSNNGDRIDNFEKVKDKQILWHGTVAEISYDSVLKDHDLLADRVIRVKMDPSDSIKADVKLKLRKDLNDKIDKVKDGMAIKFKGWIRYLGNFTQDHVVEVDNIGPYKPRKKRSK